MLEPSSSTRPSNRRIARLPLSVAALISALMLFSPPAAAQDLRPMTEDESVRQGLEHNTQLRAVRSEEVEARAAVGGARSRLLPSVDAQASYTRLSDNIPEASFSLPGIDSTFTLLPVELNRYYAEVSVEQPLFTGFQAINQTRAARHRADAASQLVRLEEAEVAYQIRQAYWRLYQAHVVRDAMATAESAVDEYVRETRRRVEEGAALRGELLTVQTRRSEVRLERIEADNAVEVAHLELNRLIGAPLDSRVAPTELPAQTPLDVRGEAGIRSHPQIQALDEQIRALEAQLRATSGGWLPNVAAVGRYVYARPNQYFFLEQDEFRSSWEAGIVLRWSLFAGGRRLAETSGARARLAAARSRAEDARQGVEVELRRHYLEVERAQRAAEVAEEGVEDAREALRITRRLFEEGVAPTSELLDAERAGRAAEARRAQAMAEREIARAALLFALGRVW